jgi:hypothetical protein
MAEDGADDGQGHALRQVRRRGVPELVKGDLDDSRPPARAASAAVEPQLGCIGLETARRRYVELNEFVEGKRVRPPSHTE